MERENAHEEMKWEYDQELKQYFDAVTGRVIPIEEVQAIIETLVREVRRRLRRLARQLQNNEISTPTFFREAALILKQSHLLAASIGRGGKDKMTARTWGIAGAELKKQYRYLNRFERLTTNGKLVAVQILRRISLYSASVRRAFYIQFVNEQKERKDLFALRSLDAAESCLDCIRYASWLWHPIAELVPPTEKCACGQFCKCTVHLTTVAPKNRQMK